MIDAPKNYQKQIRETTGPKILTAQAEPDPLLRLVGEHGGQEKKQPRYEILARIFSFAHRLELTEGQSLLQKALLAAFMTQEESGKKQKSFCSTEIPKTIFQTV